MKFVGAREKIAVPANTTVNGSVGIGAIPTGFGIEVELKISLRVWIVLWLKIWCRKPTSFAHTRMQRAATSM